MMIPEEIARELKDDSVRFSLNGLSTNWMSCNDSFISRIDSSALNPVYLTEHITKEIEIKNVLDEGIGFLDSGKYPKAIEKFDEVIFYDGKHGEALLNKSFALYHQKHFIKALRHYKKAIKTDSSLKDVEYHMALIKEANHERDNFPKIKLNIYAGDEHFQKGEFADAVESYNRALENPSRFKEKILSKLLNKKATTLLRLEEFEEALECFCESLDVGLNDYAHFGKGLCQYRLGMEICDEFKNILDISKPQMLRQVTVLNDLGFYGDSVKIADYLCKNHFKVDEFYIELFETRIFAMDKLGIATEKLMADFNIIQLDYHKN